MRSVGLSEKTYKRLLKQAESFEDSPETVIERLLDDIERRGGSEQSRVELLPESEYWLPILEILDESGGQANSKDVIATLGHRLRHRLRTNDYDILKMGEIRWSNRARFARLRMKEMGLIGSESPRGVWEITSKGREFLDDPGSRKSFS
jgi:Mrr restriction endonuclease-like protein